jgi:hypothetical protein
MGPPLIGSKSLMINSRDNIIFIYINELPKKYCILAVKSIKVTVDLKGVRRKKRANSRISLRSSIAYRKRDFSVSYHTIDGQTLFCPLFFLSLNVETSAVVVPSSILPLLQIHSLIIESCLLHPSEGEIYCVIWML